MPDAELTCALREAKQRAAEVKDIKEEQAAIMQKYEDIKSLLSSLGLDVKSYSKCKRMNNSTSRDMINNSSSSTRYRRRKETEKALTFIHGGEVRYHCVECSHIVTINVQF